MTSEVRLRKRELFAMLGYVPHPGQVLVHRSKAPRRVLACGVRWGKSTCAAMEAVAAILAPRETSIGWIVAPTYDLADRIFKRVVAIVEGKLWHRIREIVPREHKIVITNLGGGISELRAKTADNPVSLLGEALDFVVVDEAAHLKREVWEQFLSQRLVDKKGWALLLSTPRGRDFFYGLYRKGQKGRDPSVESWHSPSSDNPYLDRDMIERERASLPADTFSEQYLAEFTGEREEPCDLCGNPSEKAPAVTLWDKPTDPERCEECGEMVDDEGRTLVHLYPSGYKEIYLITLHPGREMAKRPPPALPV